MAIPFLTYDPNQKVFQIWISMGSSSKGHRENLDEYITKITHKFPLPVRREINALRQEINRMTDSSCIKHYSAKFTNEVGLGQLRDACQRIDREMKKIDPLLYCEIDFKEEVFGVSSNMTFYDKLTSGLRTQIMEVMLKRVESAIQKSGDEMPKATRASLIKLCESVKSLNIVQSPEVNQEIDAMKEKLLTASLREIRDDLLEISATSKDRSTSLEIVDPIKKASENKPKPKVDQNKVLLDIL